MAFRSKDMIKKVLKKVGEKNMTPGLKESLQKRLPKKSRVIMARAQRGIFAGRHIQFGNNVSEDGGNNGEASIMYYARMGSSVGHKDEL